MNYKYFKNGELKDEKIIAALLKAAQDYENGELAEVRDELVDIVNSIDEFDRQWKPF